MYFFYYSYTRKILKTPRPPAPGGNPKRVDEMSMLERYIKNAT